MSDEPEFLDRLLDAMRTPAGPPPSTVELETEEGKELLLHGPRPDYEDHGVLMIPAALLNGQ
ncbi:hypothetical protein WB388_40235 [Streptomyces brasiliscabiei]|uniref:Uncharacterized protein n=1 Tax=Streptomyces brasiliscabiei TaxID=2736302 RepID=A0ABU8GPW5_9ACTN